MKVRETRVFQCHVSKDYIRGDLHSRHYALRLSTIYLFFLNIREYKVFYDTNTFTISLRKTLKKKRKLYNYTEHLEVLSQQ